jgi:photosystem II stability/assembly factor-like uncharacterized protein
MKSISLWWMLCLSGLIWTSAAAQKKPVSTASKPQQEAHFAEQLSLGGLAFRGIGPAITSGRISDIAVHPDNRSVYYVATSSGGVWKTNNAGTTYEPLFDAQGSYSIGCITLDPNNPNVVWVGTGENNNQRSVAYGDGVYMSADGGKTWKHRGLKQSEHIGKIVVDPRNSSTVFVAAIGPLWSAGGERGLYKTSDGGETWRAVLSVDEHTGVNDIIMDPRNPDVMYASTFQRRRHVFTYVGGGKGSAMYKSTDGGEHWHKINQGLPGVDLGRIGLAFAPSNPEVMYAVVEAEQGKGGFYRSTNRGASWERRSGHNTSGNYYSEIVVHPTNPDIVFSMDVWIQVSYDGGKTFSMLGEEFKHVDNHSMWIDPGQPDYYLVGCDGGIYESFDAAKTWVFKANLPVTQFYKIAVDNDMPFYNVYGGTQDNFSLGGPSRTSSGHGIVNEDWFITNGGDGFESAIDPKNPNIVYAQSQYGVLVRYDKASGEITGIQPKPGPGEAEYRWNWDAPLMTSRHVDKRIYFAANKVFRSDDYGNSWTTISPDLTRQLDRNTLPVMGSIQRMDAVAKNSSTSPYGNLVAFHESPLDANLLYAGSDDGLIHVTEDGGKSWRKIDANTLPGVPENTYVNALLASRHDRNVVYAAFNHHKYGDFRPYIYKSTDMGRSWVAMTNNLPERGSVYTIAEDHVDKDLLFAGTEFGCFFSPDGGRYWKALSAGLPTIAVRDIAIQERENDLVLATFGRGIYILDDYSPLRGMKKAALASSALIFPIKDGLIFHQRLPLGLRGKSFQGHAYFTAPNPPVGVQFTYYLKDVVKTLKQQRQDREKEQPVRYPTYEELEAERTEQSPYLLFTIRDASGKIIRELRADMAKGVQRITWDGRYPSVNPVRLSPPSFDNPFSNLDEGILAMPGNYTVTLSQVINGNQSILVDAQPFRLNSLGGVTLPATDRPALLAFQQEVQDLDRSLSLMNGTISDIDNRLKYIKKAVLMVSGEKQALLDDISTLEKTLYQLRKSLYGDDVASTLDKPTEMSVSSRVSWVTYEMWNTTSAPTKTHQEQISLAKSQIQPLKASLQQGLLILDKLEAALELQKAPYTPGRRAGEK